MENVLIDDEIQYKRILVEKSRFPLYHIYKSNDIPLPPQPYLLRVTQSPKVDFTSEHTNVNWMFGPQTSVSTQASTWWNDGRNGFGNVTKDWDDMLIHVDADLDNKVLTRLKGQSVSIGLMFAERKKTNDLLISTLERLLRAKTLIRHPKKMLRTLWGRAPSRSEMRKAVRVAQYASQKAQTVGDAWLMYRYAWTPLVLDCRDALGALAAQERKLYRYYVRANAKLVFEGEPRLSSFAGSDDVITTTSGFVGTHIKLFYDVTNPLATAWSSLADPLQQAWDFVPFSFIVDWFCDVSTALDLRSATWGTSFTAGYRSRMSSRTISSAPVDRQSPYWWNGGINWSIQRTLVVPANRIDITVERIVLNQFPQLHLTFPLEDGLNVTRVFDLAALLTSRGAKRFRSFTYF